MRAARSENSRTALRGELPNHQSRSGYGDQLTHPDLPFEERFSIQLHQVKDARDDHVHMPVHSARQRVDLRHRLVRRLFAHCLLDDRLGFLER